MATFDYTSRDYFSIREDLFNRAAALPIGTDWTTRSPSDFGVMLVDLWAYIGDVLHYYVDRAAAETYLRTATQRNSVVALANLFDYESGSLNPATAQVTFSTTSGFTPPVVIPAGTGLVAPARNESETVVYFVTTETASMSSSANVVVPVTEGILEIDETPVHYVTSNQNKSNGAPNQKFSLRYTKVVPASVQVSVYEGPITTGTPTAVQYRYVDRLTDFSSSEAVFKIETSSDGTVQIVFGNGINGKIPTSGAEVKATYLRSVGSSGNIAENRINTFKEAPPIGVRIGYSTEASGGFDEESIISLKANIPLLFRTQDRAVSLQDFKDLALRVPGVVKATAFVTNAGSASTPAVVTVYPLGYQTDYTSTTFGASALATASIQAETVSYFEPRTMVGASVAVSPAVPLTKVYIQATIQIKDGYIQKWVLDEVTSALDLFFEFDNVFFGQTLTLGEIYRMILSVEGVDYANITGFNTSNTNSLIAGNKISTTDISLLSKGAAYTLTANGGIVG